MAKKKSEIQHLKCCKHSSTYKPDLIRTQPFKWINFPIFVGIWFILFWFIICPIVWYKVHTYFLDYKSKEWPSAWPQYFWCVALLVFCVILGILLLVWRCLVPKSKSKYDKIFMNPEYGDEKEILCIHCMTFHPPGGARCPCTLNDANTCGKCGNTKESFNTCCQKSKGKEDRILQGPVYDVTLKKQQPEPDRSSNGKSVDNKRNSLRSTRSRNSSGSSFVMISSAHDAGTKDLINAKPQKRTEKIKVTENENNSRDLKIDVRLKTDQNDKPKEENTTTQTFTAKTSVKNKKPLNLQPVDVDLANRHGNIEFFGEKIPLGKTSSHKETIVNVHYEKTSRPSTSSQSPGTAGPEPALKSGSVGSMESMNKEKFNKFLHLVEINTPFTPEETVISDDNTGNDPPMSPREIFFYDLIQAAEKCENGNSPDSTHFGFYNKFEKKRPVSHILVTSDVNLDEEMDKDKIDAFKRHTINIKPNENTTKKERIVVTDLESPRILALTEAINLHTSEADEDDEKTIVRDDSKKKTTVKILRTSKKSTPTPDADPQTAPVFGERKAFAPAPRSNVSSLSEQNSTQELRSLTKESVSRFFISDLINGPPKPNRQNSECSKGNENDNDEVFSK